MSTSTESVIFPPAITPSHKLSSEERFERERQWHPKTSEHLSQTGFPDQAEKVRRCHDPKSVVAFRACSEDPEHHYKPILYSCRLPICPTCSRYRANDMVRRFGETALHYAEHGRAGFSLFHLVLTTPYGLDDPEPAKDYVDSWKAQFKTLNAVLCTCLKHELSHEERRKGELRWAEHQVGTIAAADWGEQGKLHFHLLYYGPYIDVYLLRDKWAYYTQGAARVVWLDKVEVSKKDINSVLAYVGQLEMVPEAFTAQLLSLLIGRRRIRAKGVFVGLKRPPSSSQKWCPDCGAELIRIAPHRDPYELVAGA